jgi:hypothetical protein
MKAGDLVILSCLYSGEPTIRDWGFGLIITDDVPGGNQVKVVWPQKSWTSSTLLKSRVEVINESR